MMGTTVTNVLTVDVEDYFNVEAFRNIVRQDEWDRFEMRVDIGVRRLLSLLERHGVTATFFVLGWIAERRPDLVREIHQRGHEIASHGYWHRPAWEQSKEEFRDDVRRAKTILEGIVGERVIGYRAPTFSIVERTLWALGVLAEEGFLYDSSIYPIIHDRYGIPNHKRTFHWLECSNGRRMLELPPGTKVLWGARTPFGGGGYLRIYPLWLTKRLLRSVNETEGEPVVVYVHPWELDPEQPRQAVGRMARMRHYYNLRGTETKIDELLAEFAFGPARNVIGTDSRGSLVSSSPHPNGA